MNKNITEEILLKAGFTKKVRRDTLRCKDRTTGEWYDAVLYSDINGQYVRELNDFNKKFEKIC